MAFPIQSQRVGSSYAPVMSSGATYPAAMNGSSRIVASTPAQAVRSSNATIGGRVVASTPTMMATTTGAVMQPRSTTIAASPAKSFATLATAAPATTFAPVNSSARVVAAAPTQYVGTSQPIMTTAPVTIAAAPAIAMAETIVAPGGIVETIAPGYVEVAPQYVEAAPVVQEYVETAPVILEQGLMEPLPEGPLVLTYWPLFAKGVAPVLALKVAGFDWGLGQAPGGKGTGDLWGEWLEMKPYTPWSFLPNLQVGGETIGSELAILQFLARKAPVLAGMNDYEFRVSQELLHQSEELYQKLSKSCPTILAPDKSPEDFEQLWTSTDPNTHSSQQGIPVYLAQFENYYTKVNELTQMPGKGYFTYGGCTIGEIKLYATLALLLLIDNGILSNTPGLLDFYLRWEDTEGVKDLLDKALQEWGWQQYFIAPPAPEPQSN